MLSSVESEIVVDLLLHGDNVPSNIAENIERHQTSVSRSLSALEDEDLVSNKGRGVWTLTVAGASLARTILSNRTIEQDVDES
jgi:Mn-dependent DtxR family transcriptional regulator